jgi:hypothetical protein
LLGHSSLASTQIYTHNSLSELKKVYGEAQPSNNSKKFNPKKLIMKVNVHAVNFLLTEN